MSQTGTTSITNENGAMPTAASSIAHPMVPLLFIGASGANGQVYPNQPFYVNPSTYPPIMNYPFPNVGANYVAPYTSLFSVRNNTLPMPTSIHNSTPLAPLHPLVNLRFPSQQQAQYPPGAISIDSNSSERNKNLNIRECVSPVVNQANDSKAPSITPDSTSNKENLDNGQASSSLPWSTSYLDFAKTRHGSSYVQEIDSDYVQDDFLTFIEQKTKSNRSVAELNPCANEFSFRNSTNLSIDLENTLTDTDNHKKNETSSMDRLSLDNLIEKCLESIGAVKNSTSRKVPVSDASVQCNQEIHLTNHSTQTTDSMKNLDLLEEYNSRTIQIMAKLPEDFRAIYHEECHDQFKSMAHTCDELRHLLLLNQYLISMLSSDYRRNRSIIDLENPFSKIVEDLTNNTEHRSQRQTASYMQVNSGRGIFRSRTVNEPPVQPFSSRLLDQTNQTQTKLCCVCQRPLDDTETNIHRYCQSLLQRSNTITDT